MAQGAEQREDHHGADQVVGPVAPEVGWRPARVATEVGLARVGADGWPPAGGLSLRARDAQGRAAEHDQVGPELPEALVFQAQPLHDAGGEVLHDHVADGHELFDPLDGPGLREVQGHVELAVVEPVPHCGAVEPLHAVGRDQHCLAPQLQTGVGLHANHLCPQGAEPGPTVGDGQNPAQVQNPDALERPVASFRRGWPRLLACLGVGDLGQDLVRMLAQQRRGPR